MQGGEAAGSSYGNLLESKAQAEARLVLLRRRKSDATYSRGRYPKR